ncbi:hypothetical protein SRABI118_04452 [Massilia sp. Bi118]|jgi:hypothetical protein|nr:hypothetical protein SRABI118_04452 [Massilia sp. Bi118]
MKQLPQYGPASRTQAHSQQTSLRSYVANAAFARLKRAGSARVSSISKFE